MKLFEPTQIGSMQLRNRVMLPPHAMPIGDLWGTDEQARANVAYWASRAADGVAWVGGITGFVEPQLIPGFLPTGVGARTRGLFRLPHFRERAGMYADALHAAGAYATSQLVMQAGKPFAASEVLPNYTDNTVPHVLSVDEIRWLVDEYAFSAAEAEAAGLDGVELHANHEDLLQIFMSPATNLRDDEYGGDEERRLRMVIDILAAIRARVSSKFVVGVRFNMDELFAGGYDLQGGVRIAQRLQATGHMDYLHCVIGNNWGAPSYLQPQVYGPAHWSEMAGTYRAALDVPIVYAGRVDSPEAAERVLQQGHADVVGIARAMLADPHIVSKARQGKTASIRPCIGCNDCLHTRVVEGLPFGCAVNPATGRESQAPLAKLDTPRSLLLVGGGPAGMELAALAAERGFRVTLWEMAQQLGGQMALAANIPEHASFGRFIDFQTNRLREQGVEVVLGKTATAESITAAAPDVVAIATGATPRIPEIPGTHLPFVSSAHDVLSGAIPTGERVVVIAMEDHLQPLVAARALAEHGKAVQVIYPTPAIAPLVGKYSIGATLSKLSAAGVQIQVMERLVNIEQGCLTLANIYSGVSREVVDFDHVVIAAGGSAQHALYDELSLQRADVHVLGDAYAPRRIWFATRQAYELAARL